MVVAKINSTFWRLVTRITKNFQKDLGVIAVLSLSPHHQILYWFRNVGICYIHEQINRIMLKIKWSQYMEKRNKIPQRKMCHF